MKCYKKKLLHNIFQSRVTFEDQKNINKFARLNARLNDLKEELIEKEVTV